MSMVNIHDAKTRLSSLLRRVAAGEEIVIAKAGKPIAKLVPFDPPLADRIPGTAKGRLRLSDDFDAPLPDEVLEDFER